MLKQHQSIFASLRWKVLQFDILVKERGAYPNKSLNPETNYLMLGEQEAKKAVTLVF